MDKKSELSKLEERYLFPDQDEEQEMEYKDTNHPYFGKLSKSIQY